MPGLDPQAAPAAGRPQGLGAPAPAPQQQPDPVAGALEDATPEEQELYNVFVSLTLLALYDEKLSSQIVKMMHGVDDHVSAVAEVAAAAAMRTYTASREDGAEIPGDVLLHGGREIVDAVIELAESAGVPPFTPEMAEQAFLKAADIFAAGAEEMGVYGQEVMEQDMQAINKMKASGRFDAIMQQLSIEQGQQPAEPGGMGMAQGQPAQEGVV